MMFGVMYIYAHPCHPSLATLGEKLFHYFESFSFDLNFAITFTDAYETSHVYCPKILLMMHLKDHMLTMSR